MEISLIWAMAENRVIGRDNRLPWHLPEDLKLFKRYTRGHPVIMGRKTYQSIGRPLPDRQNIVLTRSDDFRAPEGVRVCREWAEAIAPYRATDEEVFVIGGAEIYREALPYADRLYITRLQRSVAGDALFPDWPEAEFRLVSEEKFLDASIPFTFAIYERR